jgi:hypothetical protein
MLKFSKGFGIANFLFSFPAYSLIDRKVRRWLLLWTFPLLAICLLITALVFDHSTSAAYAFIIVFTVSQSSTFAPLSVVSKCILTLNCEGVLLLRWRTHSICIQRRSLPTLQS